MQDSAVGRSLRIWKEKDALEKVRQSLATRTRVKAFALLAVSVAVTIVIATVLASVRTGRWPVLGDVWR